MNYIEIVIMHIEEGRTEKVTPRRIPAIGRSGAVSLDILLSTVTAHLVPVLHMLVLLVTILSFTCNCMGGASKVYITILSCTCTFIGWS